MKVECVAHAGGSPTVVDHVRLFPRHSGIRWEYRVHENILPSINRLKGEVVWTNITIHHIGYVDAKQRERKRHRDHKLLLKNLEECPDDPFIHFNLGHSLLDGGDFAAAVPHLRESITRSEPHYSQVKKAYVLLAQAEHNQGHLEKAIEILKEARNHFPDNPELLHFQGIYLHEMKQFEESIECFNRILSLKSTPKEFSSFDVGILGFKTMHRLARVYLDLSKSKEAESFLRLTYQNKPEYLPGAYDLAVLLINSGDGPAAETIIDRIMKQGFLIEGLTLNGHRSLKERKFDKALELYDRILEIDPDNWLGINGKADAFLEQGCRELAETFLESKLNGFPIRPLIEEKLKVIRNMRSPSD